MPGFKLFLILFVVHVTPLSKLYSAAVDVICIFPDEMKQLGCVIITFGVVAI